MTTNKKSIHIGCMLFIDLIFYTALVSSIVLYRWINGGRYWFLAVLVLSSVFFCLFSRRVAGLGERIGGWRLPGRLFAVTVLMMLLVYPVVGSAYSVLRYDRDANNCTHMSYGQREFFEGFGLEARYVMGRDVDVVCLEEYGGSVWMDSGGDGHMWLEVNVLGFWIPWNSVCVMPIPPTWLDGYNYISYDNDIWFLRE